MVAMVAIDGRTRIASSHHPTPALAREIFFESLARGVAMVAMVAIDDRTRIASSRRQAEARDWCTARRRGICVSLAGFHTGRDRAARQDALVPHVGARMSRYGT